MDPFLLSLALAVATGILTIAGKLVDKGVDAALEPAVERIKKRLQAGAEDAEIDVALAQAILAAMENASFQPLFEAAHQQKVETELGDMSFDLSALARTVEKRREGDAVRVRIVKDAWNAAPYLNYLANLCNLLKLAIVDPKYASPAGGRTVTLSDVYTNLEVTSKGY